MATHDTTRIAARRRTPAPLRRGAPLGAALFARAIRSSREPRRAGRRRSQLLHSLAAGRSPSASSATRSSSTTCRSARRTRSATLIRRLQPSGRRAHHHRPRRDARRARRLRSTRWRRPSRATPRRRPPPALPAVPAHPRRPRQRRAARRGQPRRHGDDPAAVHRRRVGRPAASGTARTTEGKPDADASRAR